MGADLEKVKNTSNAGEESHHSTSDSGDDAEEDTVPVHNTGSESKFTRKRRSGSIYKKPKWQDQVSHGTTDSPDAAVLFSDDGKYKLSRAYTVASCRFRRKGVSGQPHLRAIREEGLDGADTLMVIICFTIDFSWWIALSFSS